MTQEQSLQESNSPPWNGKKIKRCVLHIGTVKTGTKTIQDYLARNRAILLGDGVFYPDTADRVFASQWEYVAAVHSEPWTQDFGRYLRIDNENDQTLLRENLRTRLDSDLNRGLGIDTLIISSEHFQSRLKQPKEIAALKDFLSRWVERFEIVIYFRRQDRLALSFLSTRLKSNARWAGHDPMTFIRSTPIYYDYMAIFKKWSDVFGKNAMKPRLFDTEEWPNGDLLQDFCAASALPSPTERAGNLNRSLNRKGFQFLSALNSLYPVTADAEPLSGRLELIQTVSALFPGKYYPISKQDAKSFYAEYEDSNNALQAEAFSDRTGTLFDDDFEEYPEERETLTPSHEDAVEVAVQLWKYKVKLNSQRQTSEVGMLKRILKWLW